MDTWVQECYAFMCIEVPKMKGLKAAVALLQREVQERREVLAEKEAVLAAHNPPIFHAVQVC